MNTPQFVMIDQQQLLELMQAKQILDAQRQEAVIEQAAEKQPIQTDFFTSPQKLNTSSFQQNDSTASSPKAFEEKESYQEKQTLFKTPSMLEKEDKFNSQSNSIENDLLNMIDEDDDSTLDLTENSHSNGNSIFSANSSIDPFGTAGHVEQPRQPVTSTINNIVINNFNSPKIENNSSQGVATHQNVSPFALFPPLNSVSPQGPSIQQAAQLAQVTQMAGGVKPLHHSNQPQAQQFYQNEQPQEPLEVAPVETQNSQKPKKEKKRDFDFPDGGWECNKCQNYNFKGRKECFRCKKSKGDEDHEGKPNHMNLPAQEKAAIKAAKSKKYKTNKAAKKVVQAQQQAEIQREADVQAVQIAQMNMTNSYACQNQFMTQNPMGEMMPTQGFQQRQQCQVGQINKKLGQERVGDWTCQRCFNHNYSFRDVCNMCYLSHVESNRMLYNQQQNRHECAQNMQQCQPNAFYQAPPQQYEQQYQPMQNNFIQQPQQPQFNNGLNDQVAQEIRNQLNMLTQTAKPFVPTYMQQNGSNTIQQYNGKNQQAQIY